MRLDRGLACGSEDGTGQGDTTILYLSLAGECDNAGSGESQGDGMGGGESNGVGHGGVGRNLSATHQWKAFCGD